MATKKIKDTEIASETPKKSKKVAKTAISDAKENMNEKPEAVWIYHTGDDLDVISFELTGKKYMIYRILQYSGLNMNTLKDGDVLKWGI